MAINVLFPAPFWPTMAQTSPGTDRDVDAIDGDGRAEGLPDAAHLEARRARDGVTHGVASVRVRRTLYCYLSQRSRSGFSSAFDFGRVHVRARDDADARIDAPLDLLALDLRDDGLDAEISHVHRILHDEPVDEARRRAT